MRTLLVILLTFSLLPACQSERQVSAELSLVSSCAEVEDRIRQSALEKMNSRLYQVYLSYLDAGDWCWGYGDRDDWMVFSAPLKADDGSALGNLYLKMEDLEGRWEPWTDSDAEKLRAAAAGVCGFAAVFLWFLLPTWVYVDARERGVRRAMLWSFLVLISVFVGLVVYLIARPEETTLKCPGCEREVNGGAYCPHCGHDLSSAFCATCRYPLKPDWGFCPSCRTEVGRSGAGETPAEGADAIPATEDDVTPENG